MNYVQIFDRLLTAATPSDTAPSFRIMSHSALANGTKTVLTFAQKVLKQTSAKKPTDAGVRAMAKMVVNGTKRHGAIWSYL